MKRPTKSPATTIAPAIAASVTPAPTQHAATPPDDASRILVGIDWADSEHVYAMLDPQGQLHRGTVEQTPEAIAQLLAEWQRSYPDTRVDVCLETSRGPLINALLEHPQVHLYPVNPNALANYRKAFTHGGGKSDPVDAGLILQFLARHREQLRPWQPNAPLTRELAALCEDRRRLVEQRVTLAQQLKALLKAYFPAILLMKPAQIYADFVVRLLLKYPTLDAAQAAGRTRLRKLFFASGTKDKIEQRLDVLLAAVPLSTDEVLLRTSARHARALCGQLKALNQSIGNYDRVIEELVEQHQDYAIVQSLPCGAKTKARIIAALGDDRRRYGSAEELAAATGIAPLTTQSGRQRYVSSRWACSKFLRQTFHEFAGLSITKSCWAKAYYQQQQERGSSPQKARRALAYKWIRIIYRCWQTGESYDEARYVARLQATQSPLAERLAAAKT
jgi:transposase